MAYVDENISGLIEETTKFAEKVIQFYEYSDDRIFDRHILFMVQACYHFKNALKDQYLVNKE